MASPKSDLHSFAGMRGTVEHCATCKARTAHVRAPGGRPVCTKCGRAK